MGKDIFAWIIIWDEFDISIDGIQFQLLLVYEYFDTYLELKLMPKNALAASADVKTSGNVWSHCNETKQKEIIFHVYKDLDEKDMNSSYKERYEWYLF